MYVGPVSFPKIFEAETIWGMKERWRREKKKGKEGSIKGTKRQREEGRRNEGRKRKGRRKKDH